MGAVAWGPGNVIVVVSTRNCFHVSKAIVSSTRLSFLFSAAARCVRHPARQCAVELRLYLALLLSLGSTVPARREAFPPRLWL